MNRLILLVLIVLFLGVAKAQGVPTADGTVFCVQGFSVTRDSFHDVTVKYPEIPLVVLIKPGTGAEFWSVLSNMSGVGPKDYSTHMDKTDCSVVIQMIAGTGIDYDFHISRIVDNIRTIYEPRLTDIVLLPIVGGLNNRICQFEGQDVHSNRIHIPISASIERIAAQHSDVHWFDLEAINCNMFEDTNGHLGPEGDDYMSDVVRALMLRYLPSEGSAGPPPPPPPPPPPSGECPVILPGQTWFNACYNWLGYTKPFTTAERREVKECKARCD